MNKLINGKWRKVRYCFDEDAGEFFNVGVIFISNLGMEVKMLTQFERLNCLFDNRIDIPLFEMHLAIIKEAIIEMGNELPVSLGEKVMLSDELYASGPDPETIVFMLYDDVVTLGRVKNSG